MVASHIIAVIVGIIIGLVLAVITSIFGQKSQRHKQRSGKSYQNSNGYQDLWEIKQEMARLQAEIDAVKRSTPARNGCSTISTVCQNKSSRGELMIASSNLHNEWCRAEDPVEFQKKLTAIDIKLESNNRREINNALEELKELCSNSPDVELLYRIGKAHVRLAEDQPEDDVMDHLGEGIEALSTALALNRKHGEVHKWYAILLGLRLQFLPPQQMAKDGMLFKKHCDMACVLIPEDPILHHLLGKFDYQIAGLGWFEKTMVESFIGESLNATYANALNKFMTAERLSSSKPLSMKENIENKTMIANTLVAMGNGTQAEKWFQQIKGLERIQGTKVKSLLPK